MQETHLVFAFHQADRVSHHSQGNEIVVPSSPRDDLDNSSSRLAECLDGSQHIAVVQVAALAHDAFVAGLIDIEPKDLAPKLVLHDHAACPSCGGIRLKITCLGDAWAHASKAEQTEHYGRDQRENLNGKQMIRFHRRTLFSPIELTSKQGFVTIWLLCRPKSSRGTARGPLSGRLRLRDEMEQAGRPAAWTGSPTGE